MIKESFLLAANTADILIAPSRLAAIPTDGTLTLEISATDCDPTNFGTVTLQLPEGGIPFEDLIVPQNGHSTADAVMDNETELMIALDVLAGGHVLLSYTENGTVTSTLIIATLAW